jgi:hypothetical protein
MLAMRHADDAVVVTNPEVSSVRDSDRIIGLLDAKTDRATRGERMEKHPLTRPMQPGPCQGHASRSPKVHWRCGRRLFVIAGPYTEGYLGTRRRSNAVKSHLRGTVSKALQL